MAEQDPLDLPIIPLRELVLFPGVTMPIAVGRTATLKALEAAKKQPGSLVLAVAQKENTDKIASDGLHLMGTIARVDHLQRNLTGVQLLLHGTQRGMAMRYEETSDGYLRAVVRAVDDMPPANSEEAAFVALYREARVRAAELGQKAGLAEDAVHQVLAGIDEPGRLADLVAGFIDIPVADRQELLETLPVEERLRRVLIHVQRQLEIVDAQEDLKSKVQEELGDRQKEIYLREQLRTIQKELDGGEGDDDLAELTAKLESLELPPEGRKEVDRELKRLGRLGREAVEAQVIRTFLETVAELPWSDRSDERLDQQEASTILNEDHYGLDEVKDRILEFLAVHQLRLEFEAEAAAEDAEPAAEVAGDAAAPGEAQAATEEAVTEAASPAADADRESSRDDDVAKAPILLFVGPPGVGKTSLAKSIARAMGRKYVRISLGGARDEADIRGHRRTYVGAMPGRIIQGLQQAGSNNPVFLLDEVDKIGSDHRGDPSAALLEVLDPEQNSSFRDHYLGAEFDLSKVLFIATANVMGPIHPAFRDRLEILRLTGYTEEEKLAIARLHLLPRQGTDNGISEHPFKISDNALRRIVSSYTHESGLRSLERQLGKICRKVARRHAEGNTEPLRITASNLQAWLGSPPTLPDRVLSEDRVGVATGLAVTSVGGDVLFVEALTVPGDGRVTLTGSLGAVMKESAEAALSFVRSRAADLGLDPEQFRTQDLHVHVPEGATPKDGPSAGTCLISAIVSAFTGVPIHRHVAMTGEVTLRGAVLPVGGVRDKVLAARRAGVSRVILAEANRKDLSELPAGVRRDLDFEFVSNIEQVLQAALVSPPAPRPRRGSSDRDHRPATAGA